MDTTDLINPNSNCNNKILDCTLDSQKVEEDAVDVDVDVDESSSLLSPRKGGMSKKRSKKCRRKVQWNDNNGNKLAEVLEFQPSDNSSDTDEEDSDACICTIM